MLALGSAAEAQSVERYGAFFIDPQAPETIFLEGEIADGDGALFEELLADYPGAETLVLNSPGGIVDDGLSAADAVFEAGIATVVPSWAGCYSACAYIFFGGSERYVAGELGVHQFSSDLRDVVDAQRTVADILDVLNRFDTPPEVISAMLRTEPDEMYVFTLAQIDRLEINRGFAGGIDEFEALEELVASFSGSLDRPDWDLEPTFGDYRIGRGGLEEPLAFPVLSGGPIEAERVLGGACTGFIAEPPDFRVFLDGSSGPLVIGVRSAADATLVVNDPSADWICDDDGGVGLNPEIRIGGPLPGQYDIWIGTYDGPEPHDAELLLGTTSFSKPIEVLDPSALERLGSHQDWAVYRNGAECLLHTVATDTEPAPDGLAASTLAVSVNSYLGVHSISVGFDYRLDDEYYAVGVVDGGPHDFAFEPEANVAVLFDPDEEESLTTAMRRGIQLVVASIAADGSERADAFSLQGFTAALNRAREACGSPAAA